MPGSDRGRESNLYEVLSQKRRRRVILIMAISGQQLSIRYLAEMMAVLETGSTPRLISGDAYQLERQSLQRTHLDELQRAGVIEIGTEENTVARGPEFTAALELLEPSLRW